MGQVRNSRGRRIVEILNRIRIENDFIDVAALGHSSSIEQCYGEYEK